MSRSAAIFDLDRTLLPQGSGPAFARALAALGVPTPSIPGQNILFGLYNVLGESRAAMQLARQAAKRAAGLRRDDVARAARAAVPELLDLVHPHVPGLLAEHRRRGDVLVMATTSPYDLVVPLGEALGFDIVLGTRYVEHEGSYTGEVEGELVWGEGKLLAVRAWAEAEGVDLAVSAAYSDSWYDQPLLAAVGRPVAVNPDPRLAAAAALRRWPVRYLDAPEGVPRVLGVEPFDVVRRLTARPEVHPYARFVISGTEHIPRRGPAIIVANHRSYFDPAALAIALARAGRNGRFLAKREVTDAPVLGTLVRSFGTIRVDRGTGSSTPLEAAAAALAGGEVVVILPQGTIPRGEAFFDPVLVGRPGAARLAADLPDVPVIPIGLWGTERVWPRSAKVPNVLNVTNPPTVEIRVGRPLDGLARSISAASLRRDTGRIMSSIMDLLPSESRQLREVSEAELRATMPDGRAPDAAAAPVPSDGPAPDRTTRKRAAPGKAVSKRAAPGKAVSKRAAPGKAVSKRAARKPSA